MFGRLPWFALLRRRRTLRFLVFFDIASHAIGATQGSEPPPLWGYGPRMANEFSGSAVVDRPIAEVFEFLAAGTNDPKFSPRVQEIRKTTDGPVGVGTVFESRVKDAGMKTSRTFEITEYVPSTRIRWTERSKNLITVTDGGYDLESVGENQTRVTIHNTFAGHGLGKLLVGFALRAARKDAPAFAARIKAAIEAS